MEIYKLALEKIPEVSGEYTTIATYDGFVYVRSNNQEELKEPFIPSELPISYVEGMKERLDYEKIIKETELNNRCNKLLESFESSALKEAYIYDMKQEDQINLLGLVIANVDSFFRCAKKATPNDKQNIPHTKEQIKQVYNDGLKTKSEMIYICGVLKEHLKSLQTIEEIKALKWEDYEQIKTQKGVKSE
ncbi:hypothetical protein [Helicobacter cappadocius]|uniref:Uncharacterized protein n=1 Tax=Helicobacter cappadocius TaxID=3063998 RepID=A0AA90PT62_9HELI|nr:MULTISPECIES: hypothetical protein [unclassified Helicobacter]MDO7253881.1 hypothetical protein [Helicobacter sp. faydin-H75]MDP2539742.1 hypothetical protein [Helicobacter sp. faydin-H76]